MRKNLLLILSIIFVALSLSGCSKEDELSQVPEVITFSVSDVSYQSATCGGYVNSNEMSITSQGICWSTKPIPTIADSLYNAGNENGSFTIAINNLKPDSTYYVRAYASNGINTTYGSTMKFKTKRASFSVTTTQVNSILHNSAICEGTISINSEVTHVLRGVCWSLLPNPTIEDFNTTVTSTSNNFSAELSNLLPNKLYYVRAYAATNNELIYGDNLIFETRQTALFITTPILSNITLTTVDYSGTVTSEQPTTITARGVCWSSDSIPTIANNKSSDGIGDGTFTSTITGLKASTTYYIRTYVTDNEGTVYGNVSSFKTKIAPILGAPTVITLSVVNLDSSNARLQGQITSEGNSAVTSYGYYCSKSDNPDESNSGIWAYDTGTTTNFSLIIYSLTPGAKYYIRAFAKNSFGTGFGNVIEYTH